MTFITLLSKPAIEKDEYILTHCICFPSLFHTVNEAYFHVKDMIKMNCCTTVTLNHM